MIPLVVCLIVGQVGKDLLVRIFSRRQMNRLYGAPLVYPNLCKVFLHI